MAKSPHPSPYTPISSPTAHEPPDGRARSSATKWDPGPDSTTFALVPAASYNTLVQLRPLTSRLLRGRRRLRRLLLPAEPGSDVLHALLARPAELSDGSPHLARAFAVVVFAILTNHVRRMVLPALGVGGFGAPITALKLAAGSPAIFLKEEMETGILGRSAGWEGASKVIGDIVGGFAVRGAVAGTPRRWDSEADKAMVVTAVVYCVWVLGCAEYVHARAVHTVAVSIAYAKLIRGGPTYRQALREILLPSTSSGVLKVLGSHLELAYYVTYGLLPLLCLAARSAFRPEPRRGGPGLALLVTGWAWGTGYVTRYSNKYYIGLEMSGLLLVVWWVLAAAAVFVWRALRTRFKVYL
ncbi:uncharacterized protein GLRG_05291 [Colletotrichum graminicola M1.001]|uniref:Uncharacterized protein n=1 Tax=Colletotrichum graminicola (strain M1.001 / M2 / FGSC 10212) TaxID=645133 RepID=E3QHH6_COLGM|nr:uncharacterized protein GLRG_05291 [Colletotrichum graminicola M1.001]EFQ30147.1 hypothetical protein GLRG_05291 [Colletotrichum graminicola M1.001]